VSDNGPQLVSKEWEDFLVKNGIKHKTLTPYHPVTNGSAENALKSFKKGIKTALLDLKNSNTEPNLKV
jgi:transposase InsO family protein